MLRRTINWTAVTCFVSVITASAAHAQIVEAVGERALGMGGAFVAVADDSSAAWWNPAAQAAGPFFDLSIGRAVTERQDGFPAGRDRVSGFALSTPVIGAHVWRLRTSLAVRGPTAGVSGGRQDGEAPRLLQEWSATSVGATIVQTVLDGTHIGGTVKYVRGRVRSGFATSATGPEDALGQAGDLDGGETEGQWEFDLGALATAGPVRLGLLVRNVRGVEFGDGTFRLPRQARFGVAVSAAETGGPPLTISADADLGAYEADGEQRRVIAVGAEQWFAAKRLGVRGGARFNTVGDAKRALTAGVSVALRPGSYLEAHVVGGGSPAEQGWGTGVRVSF
jgi:hypothetical protein